VKNGGADSASLFLERETFQSDQANLRLEKRQFNSKNSERIEALLYWTDEIYCCFNSNLDLVDINNAGLVKAGLNPSKILGINLNKLCPDIKQLGLLPKLLNVMKTGRPLILNEVNCRIFDANCINLKAFRLDNELGMIISDVTDIKHNRDNFSESQAILRNLTLHLQSLREEEGRRIARQLHDEMAPVLTALKMDLSWINERIPKETSRIQVSKSKINSMIGIIDTTIGTVQKICAELRPALLDDLGLLPAIEWSIQEFQGRSDIDFHFDAQINNLEILDPLVALCLFRIIQEGLTNCVRHANATEVKIFLKKRPRNKLIELIIKDNGRGIKKEEAQSPHSFGLIGMSERIIPYGGTMRITGIKGKGTTLIVTLPFFQKQKKKSK
jgi:signal transduction histidine kinase